MNKDKFTKFKKYDKFILTAASLPAITGIFAPDERTIRIFGFDAGPDLDEDVNKKIKKKQKFKLSESTITPEVSYEIKKDKFIHLKSKFKAKDLLNQIKMKDDSFKIKKYYF
jgi:hypothetical protein